jgi:hypothetical protein
MASSATAEHVASQAQASSATAQEASQAQASSATAQEASQAMASSATAEEVASQARASSATAEEASQARASSATAQKASQAMASSATAEVVASQAQASSATAQEASQAQASSATAQEASQAQASSATVEQMASQAQASSATAQEASQATASSATAQQASQARASQATASAAEFSGAIQSLVAAFANTNIAQSALAVQNLANLVMPQVQALKDAGSYQSASDLLVQTLDDIRMSVAFLNSDPSTIDIVSTLAAMEMTIYNLIQSSSTESGPSDSANSDIAKLNYDDIDIATTAAYNITQAAISRANFLFAIGSYSQAESFLSEKIEQLNNSTAAGTPTVQEYISQLEELLSIIQQADPEIISQINTASQAMASSAVASSAQQQAQASSAVAQEASQAQASQAQVSSAVAQGASQAQASSAQEQAYILQTQTSSQAQASSAVAQGASQAQASAAQIYYTNALQGNDIQLALTAAASMVSSITSTVNSLVSSGSYSTALTLITEALQQLMASNAYLSNDEQMIGYVQQLNTLAQSVVEGNPGAQASAAQASAAQSYYLSALEGSEASSVEAVKSLVAYIQTVVQQLITIGSFSAALTLISETISQIQSSTAFTADNAEVIALVGTLNTLATTVSAQNPTTRISQASAARATGASTAMAPSAAVAPSTAVAPSAAAAPAAAPPAAAAPAPAPPAAAAPAPAPPPMDPAVLAALMAQIQQKPLVAAAPPGSTASAAQAVANQLVTSLQTAITSMNNTQKQLESQNAIIKNPASSPTDKQAAQAAVAKLTTELATYRSQVVSYVLQIKTLQPGLISADTLSSLLEASGYGEGYGEGYGYGYGKPVSGGSRKSRKNKKRTHKSKKSRRGRK